MSPTKQDDLPFPEPKTAKPLTLALHFDVDAAALLPPRPEPAPDRLPADYLSGR
jgi:hypothetical protein